mmetsp:Transcript_40158/g.40690  ORF Transcript_40158/g.40690 Transcript_40158/m.40690 type:complete len:322 (-) Transcript_40158:607-1572(-)
MTARLTSKPKGCGTTIHNNKYSVLFQFLTVLFLLLAVLPATTTATGCQACASSGNCEQAFHNGPGQFCGNWEDNTGLIKPCCCPNNYQRKDSSYECICHDGSYPPDYKHRSNPLYYSCHGTSSRTSTNISIKDNGITSTKDNGIVGFAVLVFLVFCFFCCCFLSCFFFKGKPSSASHSSYPGDKSCQHGPSAPPAYNPDASTADAYAYPIYSQNAPAAPVSYGSVPTTGGGGNGMAAGAVGGFLSGALAGGIIGNIMGESHQRREEENRYGSGGGGWMGGGGSGGGDIAGDSGGWGGSGGGGGGDIAGDSGGWGGDIAGDS